MTKKKNRIGNFVIKNALMNDTVIAVLVFATTLIVGLVAHGFMFFNKITFFDDVTFITMNDVGLFFNLGRWLFGVLNKISSVLFGNYSLPVVCGFCSLIIIAFTNVLIVKILDIKNPINIVLASSIITISTGTVVLYAYMHAAIIYCLSIFLSVLSTYIYVFCYKTFKNKVYRYLFTATLMFLSMSIVQNYFLFGVIVYLYYIIIHQKKDKKLIYDIVLYFLLVTSSMVLYIIFNKVLFYVCNTINDTFELGFRHFEFAKYQGIDQVDRLGFLIFDGTINVLKHIILPDVITYGNLIYIYYFIVIIAVMYIVVILFTKRIPIIVKFINIFTIILLFFVVNSIYILSSITYIYGLTLHQKTLIYLFPIIMIEHVISKSFYKGIVRVLIVYMIFYNIVLSNRIYLFRNFKLNNELSWYTTLISKIESVDGFDDGYDIYIYGKFIGDNVVKDDLYYKYYFADIDTIYPYGSDSRNFYNWKKFMAIYCGFNTSRIHTNDMSVSQNIINSMPSYPDDGSIRVVDDRVIVKFSEVS